MKSLEQIKNDYAVSEGFESWKDSLQDWNNDYLLNDYIEGLMKIYAMECLKLASENFENNRRKDWYDGSKVSDIESITNEKNIIK